MRTLSFILLSLFLISCSKKEILTREQLVTLLKDVDENIIVSNNKDSNCSGYGKGCKNVQVFVHKDLSFLAIEYSTKEEAIIAAKKIRGYYLENWAFDDMKGEPVLERLGVHGIQAKVP